MKSNNFKRNLNIFFVLLIFVVVIIAIAIFGLTLLKGSIVMKLIGSAILIADVRLIFEYSRIAKFIRKC